MQKLHISTAVRLPKGALRAAVFGEGDGTLFTILYPCYDVLCASGLGAVSAASFLGEYFTYIPRLLM